MAKAKQTPTVVGNIKRRLPSWVLRLLDTTTTTNQPACTAEKEHTDGEPTHLDKVFVFERRR